MADDLDPTAVSPEFLKEGSDWLAVFNPRVRRVMDVQLHARFAHDKVVCSVQFSPNNTLLAVGMDGGVSVYNVATRSKTALPFTPTDSAPEKNYFRSIAFSRDGALVAAGSEDKLVRVWSTADYQLLATLAGHSREIYALGFSPSGALLSGSRDRTIRIWPASALSSPSTSPDTPSEPAQARTLIIPTDRNDPDAGITALAVSPDGQHVASGALSGKVRIWALDGEGDLVAEWAAHAKSVYSANFLPVQRGGGAGLVTGSLDRTLKRWDLQFEEFGSCSSSCLQTMEGHKDYVLTTAVIQEGPMMRAASGSRDGMVRLWDLKTGETQFLIQGHRNTVTAVDLSADGKLVASGSGDGEARVWSYTMI